MTMADKMYTWNLWTIHWMLMRLQSQEFRVSRIKVAFALTYYGTLDIDNQNGHTFLCPMWALVPHENLVVVRNKAGWHLAIHVVEVSFCSRIVILHLLCFGKKVTRGSWGKRTIMQWGQENEVTEARSCQFWKWANVNMASINDWIY